MVADVFVNRVQVRHCRPQDYPPGGKFGGGVGVSGAVRRILDYCW
jgi:hypothetical protein